MGFACIVLAGKTDLSGAKRKVLLFKNMFKNYISFFFYINTVLTILFFLQFYLASDHKTFRDFAKKSRLQKVFLTGELSYLTFWQAKSLDPQLRLEHEGCPVPVRN